MAIKLGPTNISKAYLGSTALSQIYLGAVPLFQASGPATKTWASHDGFRISSGGIGNNDRRDFEIHQFAPSLEGVGQLDYSSLVPGQNGNIMSPAANAIDDLTNTKAQSAADQRTASQGFGATYLTPRAADGFNSLYNQSDNGMVYEIDVSDNAGGAWAQVMEYRALKQFPNTAAFVNIPLPWTELSAYSLQVQSILCRWPEFTQVEQDAMGQFLTDLETAGVLHYVIGIWPLFAQDELTSRSPGRGSVDPLTVVGTPSHVPGVGWKFDGASQALKTTENQNALFGRYNFFDGRPQVTDGQNKGVTWFLQDADNDTMNAGANDYYIFGANDGTNKFYSYFDTDRNRVGNNLYGGDGFLEGEFALQIGEPISIYRKDTQFYYRFWTDDSDNFGSNSGTLGQPGQPFMIGNQNNSGNPQARGVRATMSMFLTYDMNTLVDADTLAIHNAMITMMDSLGIRQGHTPEKTFGDIVADAYPQPLEAFERAAIKLYAETLVAFGNNDIPSNHDIYIPALTDPDNAVWPMFGVVDRSLLTQRSWGTGAAPLHVPGRGFRCLSTDANNGGFLSSSWTPDAFRSASNKANAVGGGIVLVDAVAGVARNTKAYWGSRGSGGTGFRHSLILQQSNNRHQIFKYGSSNTSTAIGNSLITNEYVQSSEMGFNMQVDRASGQVFEQAAGANATSNGNDADWFWAAESSLGNPINIMGDDVTVGIAVMQNLSSTGDRTAVIDAMAILMASLGLDV